MQLPDDREATLEAKNLSVEIVGLQKQVRHLPSRSK